MLRNDSDSEGTGREGRMQMCALLRDGDLEVRCDGKLSKGEEQNLQVRRD